MKLLIVTQVIDIEHPILGFFVRWSLEFSKHCEHVHIICLQEGKHSLPSNVTVHSLGKESGAGRLTYLWRFYKLIWQLRHEYDNVFVHMNQIYVLLGAPLWRAWGKRIGLWYTHGTVSPSLLLAEKLCYKVFTASRDSFKIETSKVVVIGHGIDTKQFVPKYLEKDIDLITVGRISKSKNLITLVRIIGQMQSARRFSLTIVGAAVTEEEKEYQRQLYNEIRELKIEGQVSLVGMVSQSELPDLLNKAKVFVTAAQNGSLDKAILEAMSCGLPIVSMAVGSMSLPLGDNQVCTETEFTNRVVKVLEFDATADQKNHEYISNNHSISSLVPNIVWTYV